MEPVSEKQSKEEQLTLELLDTIGRNSEVSQRHLARQLGVALGLANSYLKRCVRKGFVKVAEAPANRYLYYLTPTGFAEKSRLTAKYLSCSFAFYRHAGESCQRVYADCRRRGWQRLLLCGLSELAEIAALRALEADIEIVGVYEPDTEQTRCVNRPVYARLDAAPAFDACMLTDLRTPQQHYRALMGALGRSRVLVPDMLRLDDGQPPAG